MLKPVDHALADLKKRYSEPHRFYHALKHIEFMLARRDEVSHLFKNPIAVDFAIWYHDAIYDPTQKDNELRSADLFLEHHSSYLDLFHQGYTVDLILATIAHRIPPHKTDDFNTDCALFLDLDLSSLGTPWEEFIQNTYDIRKEYCHVPDELFNEGRGAILENFLNRDPLYFSPYFQNYFQENARRNLKKSIKILTGKDSDKYPWITYGI
jgi:predicted metal-dependent HD superfamily phosphohydrolase